MTTNKRFLPSKTLERLFHHKWAVPALAVLWERRGAKRVTIQNVLGASPDSVRRTLDALIEHGLVQRNPGYGHPLRPEYILTADGGAIGEPALRLWSHLTRTETDGVALRKWSLPVIYALGREGGRFGELQAALPPSTPRALASCLRELREAGIVERAIVDADPPRTEYRLSPAGGALLPLVDDLVETLGPDPPPKPL